MDGGFSLLFIVTTIVIYTLHTYTHPGNKRKSQAARLALLVTALLRYCVTTGLPVCLPLPSLRQSIC
jgi:hypothetical protein